MPIEESLQNTYLYCLFSAIVRNKYGNLFPPSAEFTSSVDAPPSALYVITGVLKCVDNPAMGSIVSEHAGPKIKIIYTVIS